LLLTASGVASVRWSASVVVRVSLATGGSGQERLKRTGSGAASGAASTAPPEPVARVTCTSGSAFSRDSSGSAGSLRRLERNVASGEQAGERVPQRVRVDDPTAVVQLGDAGSNEVPGS
jgi:hypothetical protein